MEYQKVYIAQDNDGHNYVLPYELKEQFDELLEESDQSEEAESVFIDMFSGFMTGGSLDLVELYIKTN